MNRSSTWHTFARLAVPAVLPLGVFLAAAGMMSIPPDTRGIDVVAGRDLFRAHCGSCHFAKAGFPAHLGPNLHDIGRVGATRKSNMTAAQYILESILEPAAHIAPSSRPGMPPNVGAELHPDQVRNIVAFLAGCGAHPDYEELARLAIPDRRTDTSRRTLVRLEDMELGEQVLRGKGACLSCHGLHHVPESKVFTPGIFGVGLADRERLRESVVNPSKEIKPHFRCFSVTLASGKVLTGTLMFRDDRQLMLCERAADGQLVMRTVPLADVEYEEGQPLIVPLTQSLMPAGFEELLTPRELDAVVTLIYQLN